MSDIILDQEQVSSGYENNKQASFVYRTGAFVMDFLIFIPVLALAYYNTYHIKNLFLMLMIYMSFSIYKIYMEGQHGATLGKMGLQIKVIDNNRKEINLEKAIMRNSFYIIGGIIGILVEYKVFTHPDFMDAITYLDLVQIRSDIGYGFLEILNMGYGIIIIISVLFIFGENRQTLHDKIANTLCITV